MISMARKKNNKDVIWYANLSIVDIDKNLITNDYFLDTLKVKLDYDLYNSFKKLKDGSFYLNDKNEKLLEKTLNRFIKQALDEENMVISFDTENMELGLTVCEGCGCRHVYFMNVVCFSDSFPKDTALPIAVNFMDKEYC